MIEHFETCTKCLPSRSHTNALLFDTLNSMYLVSSPSLILGLKLGVVRLLRPKYLQVRGEETKALTPIRSRDVYLSDALHNQHQPQTRLFDEFHETQHRSWHYATLQWFGTTRDPFPPLAHNLRYITSGFDRDFREIPSNARQPYPLLCPSPGQTRREGEKTRDGTTYISYIRYCDGNTLTRHDIRKV